jgi:nudix-type nucleoside diphosphatase (YffH/AdpP family)
MSKQKFLFLYGTLLHESLAEIVAGRRLDYRSATLKDHAVYRAEGGTFPVILTQPGGLTSGAIVEVDEAALDRLDFYESGHGYDLKPITVETDDDPVEAHVYVPRSGAVTPTDEPWFLSDWAPQHGQLTVAAASEAMSQYGIGDAQALAHRFPRYRARAWTRQLASQSTAPAEIRSPYDRKTVDETGRMRAHNGFFALDIVTLDHPTYSGGRSGVIEREAFIGSDAALLLPYDPSTDTVLLVEQFRAGPYMRGDPRPWALEPVAGLVDPGEDPALAARREAQEEAGLNLSRIIPVIRGYPSPGATTEFYHCFVGICDLSDAGGPGGLAHENEDIWSHVLPFNDALKLVASGEANVLPLATLLYWLALNRGGLDAHS